MIRLKETWHADRPMTADKLTTMDARLAAMPRIRLSEAGQRALRPRAQRGYGGRRCPSCRPNMPAGRARAWLHEQLAVRHRRHLCPSVRSRAVCNKDRRGSAGFNQLAGRTTMAIFLLLPPVTLKKRLDVEGVALLGTARLPGLVLQAWRD